MCVHVSVHVCMCVPHKFPSWPAGQDRRNEQSVGVKDEQERAGSRSGIKDDGGCEV